MSAIGAMFAPYHQEAADELVRVCRPGGTIGLLSWTPEGMIGSCSGRWGRSHRRRLPARSPRRCGAARTICASCSAIASTFRTPRARPLEATAFDRPRDLAEHFKARYGPTIAVQANARRNGREAEFVEALDAFSEEWNRGTPDRARFEMEYLLAVGTRA